MRTVIVRFPDRSEIRLKADKVRASGAASEGGVIYVFTDDGNIGVFPLHSIAGCWFADSEAESPE